MKSRAESSKPTLSVVVPTLGRGDRIAASIPPLVAALARRSASGDEVLIVDDSGREAAAGSVSEMLSGLEAKEHGGVVRVVTNDENLGFGPSVMRAAKEAKGDLLLIVQDDVVLEEVAVDRLIHALVHTEDVFAVTPRVRAIRDDGTERATFESMVSVALVDDRIVVREKTAPEIAAAEAATAPREIEFAPSSAMLMRRAEFLDAGGFDELFSPFDFEDVDLSLSVRRRGRRILEVPVAKAIHRRMGDSLDEAVDEDVARAIRERNRLLLRWKHLSTREDAADHLVSLWRNVLEAGLAGDRRILEEIVLAFDKLADVATSRSMLSGAAPLSLDA